MVAKCISINIRLKTHINSFAPTLIKLEVLSYFFNYLFYGTRNISLLFYVGSVLTELNLKSWCQHKVGFVCLFVFCCFFFMLSDFGSHSAALTGSS